MPKERLPVVLDIEFSKVRKEAPNVMSPERVKIRVAFLVLSFRVM